MKNKRAIWIPVAAGILRKENKVLLGKRPETGSLPGLWEFPGGKIELGETPEVALARELREELGIEADISDLFMASSHTYGDKAVLLLFYWVDYWKGEPKGLHHSDLKWLSLEEISNLNIPDSNREILPKLIQQRLLDVN